MRKKQETDTFCNDYFQNSGSYEGDKYQKNYNNNAEYISPPPPTLSQGRMF